MSETKRWKCACCGNYSMPDSREEICPVCFWHQDDYDEAHPDHPGGPNHVGLNEARENFKLFGATERRFISYVRPPLAEELPENNGEEVLE